MIKLATIITLLIGLTSSRCNQQNTSTNQNASSISAQLDNDLPSRWQLYSAYRDNEIVVIYGSNEEQTSIKYANAIETFKQRISKQSRQQLNISFKDARSITAADIKDKIAYIVGTPCLLYTSPSPRDQRGSRMPSSA